MKYIPYESYEGKFTYSGDVVFNGPRVHQGSYSVKADTIEQAEARIREQAEQTVSLVFPKGYKVTVCGVRNDTVAAA